jgi:hypothetical protein
MSESHNPERTTQDIVAKLMRELDDVIVLIERPAPGVHRSDGPATEPVGAWSPVERPAVPL